jgi:predicted HicB family RNase H-like nuclease
MTKPRMAGIRADNKTLASWARKAKAAGMSLNKWACLVLNNAPNVKPATLVKGRSW